MTVSWPAVLEARSWNANLRNMMASGGRSSTGRDQRVFSDAGFWEISISGIRIRNREEATAFRAMVARLRAGEDILVPLPDMYAPLGSRTNGAAAYLDADAPLRATEIRLTATGAEITAGSYFSMGDRLYLVTDVVSGPATPLLLNQIATDSKWSDSLPWSDAVAGTIGYQSVRALPPLRSAYAAGTDVRLRDLLVRCVLKDPSDGDLDLDLGRFGTPSLNFIETL